MPTARLNIAQDLFESGQKRQEIPEINAGSRVSGDTVLSSLTCCQMASGRGRESRALWLLDLLERTAMQPGYC